MTALAWDQVGERLYETGVDHGVLYLINTEGEYDLGVAWNGLTTVTESPSGAESNPQYADNIKYLNLLSAEDFGATIEAFTYPDEFAECDGSATPSPGVVVGQQGRKVFGLAYRTRVGDDISGADAGYKLHLVYGAQASPSEKAYSTINDSPEAIAFSWEVATTPVPVTGLKPTSLLVIDSTKVGATELSDLEDILFGTESDDPRLPMPDEVIDVLGGTALGDVNLTDADNQPSFNQATNVITLPAVTGVQWQIDGEDVADGAQPALGVGETVTVEAKPEAGYNLVGDDDWTFSYEAP
jgi:hypothetical protein